ncbi:hypothetical protein ACLI4U_15065 [Natrialbaceae archaeon A-CW2]
MAPETWEKAHDLSMELFENLFYKVRYLYIARKGGIDREGKHNQFRMLFDSGITNNPSKELGNHYNILCDDISKDVVDARLKHKDCTLVRPIEKSEKALAGYGWLVHPSTHSIWHDKILVPVDCPLLFNAKIFENYRGRGIFTAMHFSRINHVFENYTDKCMIVVEQSNTDVLPAYDSWGWEPEGINYLYKVFGVNMVSVVHLPEKSQTHFVLTKSSLP